MKKPKVKKDEYFNPGLAMKYFVLNPSGNHAYAKASRSAMKAYARSIKSTNPYMHDDLVKWVKVMENEQK